MKERENVWTGIELVFITVILVTSSINLFDGEVTMAESLESYLSTELSENWQQIWSYETDFSPSCVSVSPDGRYIAVGSSGKVYFLDRLGRLLWSYPIDFPIVDISMTADISQIVAGGSKGGVIPDGIVYCLNESGELFWSLKSNGVSSVSLSQDGMYFAFTYVHGLGWHDIVSLWDYNEGEWLWRQIFGKSGTAAVSISVDGNYIAVSGAKTGPFDWDAGVCLYDKAGNLLWEEYVMGTDWLGSGKHSVSISSDGKYVAAGNRKDNSLYFFDRDQGFVWSYNTGAINGVSVSGDGTYIAAATNCTMYLFDRHQNLLWTSEIDKLEDVAISTDGTMIAVATKDNRVYTFVPGHGNAPLFKAPCEGIFKITQGNNGSASHFDHGTWDNTYAIDIALPIGSNVLAPADGVVNWYDDDTSGAGGKELAIEHTVPTGEIFTTVYLHLSEIIIKSGPVKQGEIVAKSGNTGDVTGPHLHFHLWNGVGSRDSHTMPIERLVMKQMGIDQDFKEYNSRNGDLDDSKIAGKYFESNNIIVLEEPDMVSKLRDRINHKLKCQVKYPPYFLDPNSFISAVTTVWAEFTSWITRTHLTEKYDELYQAGIDYGSLSFKALIDARNSLDRDDIVSAEKYLQKSYTYDRLSEMSFCAATEVFDNNLQVGEILAEGIKDGCEASVKFGLGVTNPAVAKVADYIYIGVDYAVDRTLVGEEEATKNAIIKAAVTTVFNQVKFKDLGDRTIADYTNNRIGRITFPMLQEAFHNNEQVLFLLSKAIKECGVEIEEEVSEEIAIRILNELEKTINLEQAKVKSPVELRVYDLQGKTTGLINGQVEHGISRSVYCDGTVTTFFPTDTYRYELSGTAEGTYVLDIVSIKNGAATTFTGTDIPTTTNAIHEYTIDWQALSQGEKGVTVHVDLDGDGTPEKTFTSGDTFTMDEEISVEDLEKESDIPKAFALFQNYPNPFNPATEISFALPENAYVTLKVFNALGQKVVTLVDVKREVGSYRVTWDATGFPSGVYFYRLVTEGFIETRKMMLMK